MGLSARVIVAFLLVTGVSRADDRFATTEDIERLQLDLTQLEVDLATAEELPEVLAQRVEAIREEAVYIKVKMRKHVEAGGESTGVLRDDVRGLRLDIADLRSDARPYTRPPAEARHATLSGGTELAVRLEETLSSRTAQPGDRFSATLVQPALDGNLVALDAGSPFHGRVELVDQANGRTDRTAKLVLAVDQLERNGETFSVSATVVRASERLETGVGSEAKKIGIGAGLGTILGAVLGGTKGAAIGAVVGGGGSILATEGNEVELPRGTILYLRLDRDLTLPLGGAGAS